MTGELITYKAPKPTFTVEKSLELQRWIIDPSSRPCVRQDEQKLMARSASSTSTNGEVKQSTVVEKQLELQRMIIEG